MAAGEKGRFGKGYDPRRNYKGRPKRLSFLEILDRIGHEIPPNEDLSNWERLAKWVWYRALHSDWRAVEALLKRFAPERSTLEIEQTHAEGDEQLIDVLRRLAEAAEEGAPDSSPPSGDGPDRLH